MRVKLNEKKISRRAMIGKYVSWAGLAILGIGMLISFRARPGNPVNFYQAQDVGTAIERVAGNADFIAYAEFDTLAQNPALVRTLAVDGVMPSEEAIASGEYLIGGKDGALAVFVNPANDWIGDGGVSGDQLAAIYTGANQNWSDVDANWPNRPMTRISAAADTAAYRSFLQSIMVPVVGSDLAAQTLQNTETNYSLWMLASFACLIVGFIAANVGGYNVRRFGRSPRPDEMVAQTLKGFDDRYALYAWMLPAPYVFAGPGGVYTIAVRDQGGSVSNNGAKWSQPFSWRRMLTSFGQEGLGNPGEDAKQDAAKMQAYLARHLPDLETEVQPMVLFLNPNVKLDLNNPSVPVVMPKGLKALIRQRLKQNRIDGGSLEQLHELFSTTAK